MDQVEAGLSTDTVLDGSGELAMAPAAGGDFDEVVVDPNAVIVPVAAVAVPVVQEQEQPGDAQEKGIGYQLPSTTSQLDHDTFFPLSSDWDDALITVVGLADTRARTREAIDGLPNVDPTTTQEGREWAASMQESVATAPGRDQWRGAFDREGSAWRQQVDSEAGPIRMGALSFKNVGGELITGEKAVLQVRALTGLGTVIQVPLWHSGFHVSIKAPSESQMIELNRRLTDEKIVLGRTTNGLAFANTSSYISATLLDFTMDYIYDTSLQDKSSLRAMIQTPDLPLLFWGLASAIWPRGFQYARPYIDPINKAEKILKSRLGMSKLLWTDTKAFTPRQVVHMANKSSGTHSAAMVKIYREQFTVGQARLVKLTDEIAVTLKVPSAVDYVISGQEWTAEITKTVDDSFSETPEDGRRENFIVRHGQATAMRQYTHYVKSIHAGTNTIEDPETIKNILNDLSADDTIRNKFFDEARTYIDDSSLAIIGTPAADHEKDQTLPRFPHILPMNVEHTFFILLAQKVMQIIQRT